MISLFSHNVALQEEETTKKNENEKAEESWIEKIFFNNLHYFCLTRLRMDKVRLQCFPTMSANYFFLSRKIVLEPLPSSARSFAFSSPPAYLLCNNDKTEIWNECEGLDYDEQINWINFYFSSIRARLQNFKIHCL